MFQNHRCPIQDVALATRLHVQTDFTAGLRLRIRNRSKNIRLFLVTEKA